MKPRRKVATPLWALGQRCVRLYRPSGIRQPGGAPARPGACLSGRSSKATPDGRAPQCWQRSRPATCPSWCWRPYRRLSISTGRYTVPWQHSSSSQVSSSRCSGACRMQFWHTGHAGQDAISVRTNQERARASFRLPMLVALAGAGLSSASTRRAAWKSPTAPCVGPICPVDRGSTCQIKRKAYRG